MDLTARLHRRFFGSRRRRTAAASTLGISVLCATLLGVSGLLTAGAATTNGDPIAYPATVCTAMLGSTPLVQDQDVAVQAIVPNNVALSSAYDVTVPGGTANLPTSGAGFPIQGFKDVGQTYLFRSSSGSPQITGVTATGTPVNNGNPVSSSAVFTNEGSTTAITTASYAATGGGVITYTTATPHNLAANQLVDITGFGRAGWNSIGGLVSSVPTTTTFTTRGRSLPITDAVWTAANSGTITYTTSDRHGLKVGDLITTVNSTPARYNRNAAVATIVSSTSFTVTGAGATDPGPIGTKGQLFTLGSPGALGTTLGSVKTLTTARLNIAAALPGTLTTPDVTINMVAPAANSTVTSYGGAVTVTATLAFGGGTDAATVCNVPHSDPQTDGISATLVGTGGPTTTSIPTCRPPDVCATTTTTLPPAPTVTAVSPASGPTSGGTSVTITGTGFTGATAVSFGATAATGVTVNSATSITATSPAQAAGTVDVTVTTPSGTSATGAADQFTYVAGPTVTSVSPTSGPASGGTSVTITGTGFTGATAVSFGTTTATFTVDNATQITATAPAHAAGTVNVTVTTPAGTSPTGAGDQFTYIAAPTVTGVSPTSGPTAGGTSVTITGTDLTGATAVSFGATPATGFTVDSATQITATAPAHAAGTVDVTVTTPSGTSATGAADQFTYVSGPTVTSVSPTSGPASGGTSVTITGTGFTGATSVKFGTTTATFTVDNATQITATAPAHAAGTVDITVTTPAGTSPTGAGDEFTYIAAPTVTGISPISGPTAGGTSVTITGTDLTGASAVSFGGTPATTYTVDSATQITANAPAHAAGTVDVTVTTIGGTSATGAADEYTYVAAPTVTGISPTSGTTAGGTTVTITGTGFTGVSAVEFGGVAATGYTVDSATQITATAPAHAAGTVDVTVGNVGGTSATGAADQYTYTEPTGPGCGTACITVGDTTMAEMNLTHGQVFSVTLSQPATQQVTVDYTIVSGSAIAGTKPGTGADFKTKSGTLVFKPGVTSGITPITKTVAASIFGDTDTEGDETFTIQLSNPTGGYILGPGTGSGACGSTTGCSTGTILNDDGITPDFVLGIGDASLFSARSGKQSLRLPVTLSAKALTTVTVDYVVVPGTATYSQKITDGGDFGGKQSGTITFKPGATLRQLTLPIYADATPEADQSYTIVLSNPNGNGTTVVVVRDTGTGTIRGLN